MSNVLFIVISFPFFISFPPFLPLSFPGLVFLGRSLTDHISCFREAPWPSEFILLYHLSEHRRQGSEFISAQQHSKQFDDAFHPHM